MLSASIQELRVGTSDYKAAQSIAKRFGTLPYQDDYGGTRDCAKGYFERCAYRIGSNLGSIHNRPSLRRMGFRDWEATGFIYIESGTVQDYSFSVIYETSDGKWRGFGAEEAKRLPEDRAVQARISESYSVERNDIRLGERTIDLGFDLEASLTPASTPDERQQAWHFKLKCLSDQHGCGEICEVMPDAWRDFYNQRGRLDVEKYGSAYLFCTKPAI